LANYQFFTLTFNGGVMLLKKFEEMKVWQDARILITHIYEISGSGNFLKDFGLRDQIRRASVSVMSNIVEGYERDSNREFAKFLGYSKGSCGEVRSLLYVSLDQNYIAESKSDELISECMNISQQISGFEKYLR
jgi:four helix bundle protein